MTEGKSAPSTFDEYAASFSPEARRKLEEIRAAIREAVPEATERISYGMPGFDFRGYLGYYGAYRHHIGFYPAPGGDEPGQEEAEPYRHSKSTLRFPLEGPLPLAMIARLARHRADKNRAKAGGATKAGSGKKKKDRAAEPGGGG